MRQYVYLMIFVGMVYSCNNDNHKTSPLFTLKDNNTIGVVFENRLTDTQEFNVYKYRNYYNGGGVALGDINNDGWIDIYMISNQESNKLFLNKGEWQFEDITLAAGVGGTRAWSTGVTMVDINGDGWLDIYVCNSGDIKGDNKENELFINNGDNTFSEQAAQYNLNDKGYSTHASFFDYDKDGDLDAYILNNSFQAIGSFNLRKNERPKRDELGGDKLMRNDNGRFVDVSDEAGIYGSVIGFGLGITVGDVNNDGWEDIYISNDFFERDYLYINQKNGQFKEDLIHQMPSISGASMGADIADINNDGWNDIFVTEMLPSDYQRLKSVTTFEDWDRYMYGVNNGYHHQFTRNTLQINNHNSTFSEVSRMAGVAASDWSWGALFFDMDNDGLKDLFIANGIYRDLTNQDYLQYIANESVMSSVIKDDGVDYKKLIDIIPTQPIPNHAYKNTGNLSFNTFHASGLDTPSFSNGSAYGDLDNDGDLDLVVNNVNMPSFVYENNAIGRLEDANFIKLKLIGEGMNKDALGSLVTVSYGDILQKYEVQPTRGFQSTMDRRLNIGVGNQKTVNVSILWPDGTLSVHNNLTTNNAYTFHQNEAKVANTNNKDIAPKAPYRIDTFKLYKHEENNYVDFNRERLSYHFLSTRGPCAELGDLNGDSQIDLIIPGPKGMPNTILYSDQGVFNKVEKNAFGVAENESEYQKCILFDADNDGDQDIYFASGGVEISEYSEYLYDKLWFNDGNGNFNVSTQKLPIEDQRISTGAIAHCDIDGDGDEDLFVGERVKIGSYGLRCNGYILQNDGKGFFNDITKQIAPELIDIGMITDAVFQDINNDGKKDLIIIGEFFDITILMSTGQGFQKPSHVQHTKGWWNFVHCMDIDGDNDYDLILGNHGLNSRFKANETYPLRLYFKDFDGNGAGDAVFTQRHEDGLYYPYALRHNLMMRLPHLKKRFPNYDLFKSADISKIFTQDEMEGADALDIDELRSIILRNDGTGHFTKEILPPTVQLSPQYAITEYDFNKDGIMDILLGGNLYGVQPEVGRYDASYGHVLINNGKGVFSDKSTDFQFSIKGQIRDFVNIGEDILILRNNDYPYIMRKNTQQ